MGKSKEIAELGQVVSQNGGKVGIGVSTPSDTLTVDGIIVSQNASQGSGSLMLQGYGADGYINNNGTGDLRFRMGPSYTECMRIDSAGRVTMPYQPSFMVRPTEGLKYSGQGFTTVDSWTSSGVSCHNIGGHMGSTYFTAPVAGRYYFHANFLQDPGAVKNWVGYGYYVNNYLAVDVLGLNTDSYIYQRSTGSVIFSLQAGDTVHIAIRDDGGDGWIYPLGADSSPYSWFTGYLIG